MRYLVRWGKFLVGPTIRIQVDARQRVCIPFSVVEVRFWVARVPFFSTMDRSRRGRLVKIRLLSVLKLVNSVIGFAGMGMILYSRWMIRPWCSHIRDSSDSTPPWFVSFNKPHKKKRVCLPWFGTLDYCEIKCVQSNSFFYLEINYSLRFMSGI